MNSNKIILDLCGGTGAWAKPYKDAGYDVRLITLPDYDIRKWREYPEIIEPVTAGNVYGILAAPPCTEFSVAKTTAPRDFKKGMETIRACMEIVWLSQENGNLAFWALENPRGLLRRFLGRPCYTFFQWWFGNDRSKPTDLWGRFNTPKRKVNDEPGFLQKTNNGIRKRDGVALKNRNAAWYANAKAKERAITPAGFAQAFYEANK